MSDLSDVNMEGVKAMSEKQDLPIGQYLVRIEHTEKKETKDKYGEDGQKLPPNHYLLINTKVYGGPNDGGAQGIILNLWNTNDMAVQIAKSELKSIQEAIQVASPNSKDMINKWMILEVKPTVKDPQKLYRVYTAALPELLAAFADVPPATVVPAYIAKEVAAATAAAAPVQHKTVVSANVTPTGQPPLPSWATKKTA